MTKGGFKGSKRLDKIQKLEKGVFDSNYKMNEIESSYDRENADKLFSLTQAQLIEKVKFMSRELSRENIKEKIKATTDTESRTKITDKDIENLVKNNVKIGF
jgi:rRNA maturation endonuclease Nob1